MRFYFRRKSNKKQKIFYFCALYGKTKILLNIFNITAKYF